MSSPIDGAQLQSILSSSGVSKSGSIDYTPAWTRGRPNTIEKITFPKALADKKYHYRVFDDEKDLGIRPARAPDAQGAQVVDLFDYTGGPFAIFASHKIRVYVIDPDTGNQVKVAQWEGHEQQN